MFSVYNHLFLGLTFVLASWGMFESDCSYWTGDNESCVFVCVHKHVCVHVHAYVPDCTHMCVRDGT